MLWAGDNKETRAIQYTNLKELGSPEGHNRQLLPQLANTEKTAIYAMVNLSGIPVYSVFQPWVHGSNLAQEASGWIFLHLMQTKDRGRG